jgi:hypothetical protein
MPLGAVLEAVVPVLALRRFIPGLGQAMVRRGLSDRGDGRDRENAGEDHRCEFRGSDCHLQTLRLRYATLRFIKSRQNNWAAMGRNSGPEMALFGLASWSVAQRVEVQKLMLPLRRGPAFGCDARINGPRVRLNRSIQNGSQKREIFRTVSELIDHETDSARIGHELRGASPDEIAGLRWATERCSEQNPVVSVGSCEKYAMGFNGAV